MFVQRSLILGLFASIAVGTTYAQKVSIDWDKPEQISKMTPTLQVVVNPPLRRGSPIHDRTFKELEQLGADYVRFVPWLPYPRLGIPELKTPEKGKTFWDFSLIDPITLDFLNATKGHPVMLNFSTIPAWMFKTPKPVAYPDDPEKPVWDYTQGTELRDRSLKELGDYYARLVSWYTAGGFTDEAGKRHESGHHYKIAYWEVLNEPDIEHNMTPEQYTARYDAIVLAVRKVSPETKFVGISVAFPRKDPRMFSYFLNPKNHKPGVPLDMISYHFYATPEPDETVDTQQHTFFVDADGFLTGVRFIENIRKQLSPSTGTAVNEIGSISADDREQSKPGHVTKPIPAWYWNLSGATYAYLLGNMATMGIDIAGESQLVGYPSQYPSVSMVDWNTGAPNARFRVLQLLKTHFMPGNKLFKTNGTASLYGLGFSDRSGQRKILLVNKRNRDCTISLPQMGKELEVVDQATGANPPVKSALNTDKVVLKGFAVAVVTLAGR